MTMNTTKWFVIVVSLLLLFSSCVFSDIELEVELIDSVLTVVGPMVTSLQTFCPKLPSNVELPPPGQRHESPDCSGTPSTTSTISPSNECHIINLCGVQCGVMVSLENTDGEPQETVYVGVFQNAECTRSVSADLTPSCNQCFVNDYSGASMMLICKEETATPPTSPTLTTTTATPTTTLTTSGITTTTTTTIGTTTTTTTTSTSGGPISPKFDNYCYNLIISVSKALQDSPQYFTFQDLGCNTADWNIVSVNTNALYSYQDPNQIKLLIQPSMSGLRPVLYQIRSSDNQYTHSVTTQIEIVNHQPVINDATFTWNYPRNKKTFPNWNLLSGCTDQDGDSLSVVQIQKTKARKASNIVQLNDTSLYFIPEKVVLSVLPTGEISLFAPSKTNPVTTGSPLVLSWKKDISFQFQITDGDVTLQYAWGVATINSV